MRRIKIAQFGLGPIGRESLRLAAERADLEVIGAVEIDPALAGRAVVLVEGRVRLEGEAAALAIDPRLRDAFLGRGEAA